MSSQADIEAACKASSVCNLTGLHKSACIIRHSYKPIVGFLLFYSFAVSAEATSAMVVREFAHSAAKRLFLGKGLSPTGERIMIPPEGLSVQRQAYLHKEIREFCREGTLRMRYVHNHHRFL